MASRLEIHKRYIRTRTELKWIDARKPNNNRKKKKLTCNYTTQSILFHECLVGQTSEWGNRPDTKDAHGQIIIAETGRFLVLTANADVARVSIYIRENTLAINHSGRGAKRYSTNRKISAERAFRERFTIYKIHETFSICSQIPVPVCTGFTFTALSKTHFECALCMCYSNH
jgi:hypothetical protein